MEGVQLHRDQVLVSEDRTLKISQQIANLIF